MRQWCVNVRRSMRPPAKAIVQYISSYFEIKMNLHLIMTATKVQQRNGFGGGDLGKDQAPGAESPSPSSGYLAAIRRIIWQ